MSASIFRYKINKRLVAVPDRKFYFCRTVRSVRCTIKTYIIYGIYIPNEQNSQFAYNFRKGRLLIFPKHFYMYCVGQCTRPEDLVMQYEIRTLHSIIYTIQRMYLFMSFFFDAVPFFDTMPLFDRHFKKYRQKRHIGCAPSALFLSPFYSVMF